MIDYCYYIVDCIRYMFGSFADTFTFDVLGQVVLWVACGVLLCFPFLLFRRLLLFLTGGGYD